MASRLPPAAIAVPVAILAREVIRNVLREDVRYERQRRFGAFEAGTAAVYAAPLHTV